MLSRGVTAPLLFYYMLIISYLIQIYQLLKDYLILNNYIPFKDIIKSAKSQFEKIDVNLFF